MEKINRPPLSEISTLNKLEENWEEWGYRLKWSSFSRKLYLELRSQLENLTLEHCSFCDNYPIHPGTIEHYFPKKEYFCLTYYWANLFYCCFKCQLESKKYPFEYTLKPDNEGYEFEDYFYYDNDSGELRVLKNLKMETPDKYLKAQYFLKRYGINEDGKRRKKRQKLFRDILNFLKANEPDDLRTRDDFEFRYVYDYAKQFYDQQIKQK